MSTVKLGAACAALWIGASAWQAPETETVVEPVVTYVPTDGSPGDAVPDDAVDDPNGGGLVPAVEAKPLSNEVRRGLEWLRKNQHENGGWSQGEEAQGMRASSQAGDPANVADTCVAALALLRSGSTPEAGAYAAEILRAVDFVCASVEASDEESLFVTDVRGTRVQGKIGTYADTFLASMLLTEVRDEMPDDEGAERVGACLRKVLDKIEINQAEGGGFESQGWAPVLSQGLASKALNRAALIGYEVSNEVLSGNDSYFAGQSDVSADGAAAPGAAGVQLYGGSAKLGAQQEAVNNGYRRERELRDEIKKTTDKDEIFELGKELDRIEAGRTAQRQTQEAVIDRLDDEQFLAGFGNNGGEEFLSYMNISESLVVRGDDTWREWDERISANVTRVQNKDGSWTGHHCITGRTFCTATALLTLMADRVEVPAELLADR